MVRVIVAAVASLALAWLAFEAVRFWDVRSAGYPRPEGVAGCRLEDGGCRQTIGDGVVDLQIRPRDIPLMETLSLRVTLEGVDATAVGVDIRGLNMDMGMNRTGLVRSDSGDWVGETILPVCSQRRMEWEAAVLIDGDRPMAVPYLFDTVRP
jgi:hypothetical protein